MQEAPVLDGKVDGEAVWSEAAPITDFWQERPGEGRPVSEKTAVRLVYTNDTLYIGVICFDRDPHGIVVADSRRDTPLDNTDSFRVILDTYRDGLNGFVFGTNPADRADLWSANLRFGLLQAANTGFFVVYTDTRGLYDLYPTPLRTDRSLVVKFSRMFDLLGDR